VEEISSARPGSPTPRSNEMDEKVRHLRKDGHKRSGPTVTQSTANQGAGILVEPWITPEGLIHCQIHPSRRLQDAEIFGKRGVRVFGMVNYSVGNHYVSAFIRK